MIYHFSLQMAALFAGAILCLLGAIGFAMEGSARSELARFPRSRGAGIVLLSIDLVWSFWLVWTMEMGEFSAFRRPFLFALPIGFFLTMRFVDEFLAVRALGILALLVAEPLLDAAFFRFRCRDEARASALRNSAEIDAQMLDLHLMEKFLRLDR